MIKAFNYPAHLPIVAQKDKIIKAIQNHRVIIIAGDTGSGKTTQLPKMCLESGRGEEQLIGCTQPRRIAAISMAARVDEELRAPADGLVSYKIRFRDKTDPRTRIKFMTDGILLAEARSDKLLSAYDTLIIDEAHERSLNIDFLLGYLKRLLLSRDDLKLLLSSATIDTEKFARYFADACVLAIPGRTYPIEVRYLSPDTGDENGDVSYIDRTVDAVLELRRREKPGDILIFMPTERDIHETSDLLAAALQAGQPPPSVSGPATILPLFGRMHSNDQKRIFKQFGGQKIVVATNVAETSITVPGIRYVIDPGLARIASYNPRARTTKMPICKISRSSADQRMGRCGRVASGVCIRLYSEDDYNARPEFTLPEIKRSDMAETILRMAALQLGDPAIFPFIDPPSGRAIRDGFAQLRELGAINDRGDLTRRGWLMARLPLDPRISRMIIEARSLNALSEIAVIAAALTVQDPRIRPAGKEKEADAVHSRFAESASDYLSFLELWQLYHRTQDKIQSNSRMRKFCTSHYLSYQRMREWRDIHEQIRGVLDRGKNFIFNSEAASYDDVHRRILAGSLRNIAMRKARNVFQGTHGKELFIFPGSSQYNRAGSWIVAAELVETTRLYARVVAAIKPEWIEPAAAHLCRSTFAEPRWEKKAGRVVADEKVTLFGLIIVPRRRVHYAGTSPQARREAREIFIREALVCGNLGTRLPFLEKNLQLVKRLQAMEDRLRQRGIVADEQDLFAFYDARLDDDVCDRQDLLRLLKKKKAPSLEMTEADLLHELPSSSELERFPAAVTLNDASCQLSYRFAPGADDDGVTLTLPMSDSGQLDAQQLEWLVPGFLPEKILFLLKGLPKGIRKKLIPLQQTAREMHDALQPGKGSLYDALADAVYRKFRVRINRKDWPLADLPAHLAMRVRLVDESGETIRAGRDIHALVSQSPAESVENIDVRIRNRWERDGITDWDFMDLPDEIPVNQPHEPGGFVYPGLVAEQPGGPLAIRLFPTPGESRRATRNGLITLYSLQLPLQSKALQKECAALFSDKKKSWSLYQGIAGLAELREQVFTCIMTEIFHAGNGRIPDRQSFKERLEAVKKNGLLAEGLTIIDVITEALQQRRETLSLAEKYGAMSPARLAPDQLTDFRQQAAAILPPEFLRFFTLTKLAAVPRYFKALRIRIERAHSDPDKDRKKAELLAEYVQRVRQLDRDSLTPECRQHLDEYCEMLEEFKISLFAQEIKTAFPVSAKRLDTKWRLLRERACC